MAIKSNLRILMAEHRIDGISELMAKSGLSRNAINRLYKGTEEEMKSTNLKTLITLCEVFECKLSDLLEFTQIPQSKIKHIKRTPNNPGVLLRFSKLFHSVFINHSSIVGL